jgi:hypothetical protein
MWDIKLVSIQFNLFHLQADPNHRLIQPDAITALPPNRCGNHKFVLGVLRLKNCGYIKLSTMADKTGCKCEIVDS